MKGLWKKEEKVDEDGTVYPFKLERDCWFVLLFCEGENDPILATKWITSKWVILDVWRESSFLRSFPLKIKRCLSKGTFAAY